MAHSSKYFLFNILHSILDERPGLDREERPGRGRGRGRGRDDEEESYGAPPSKPSAPATLFDFLETKIKDGELGT
jgi:tudor domain-containing protein 3